MVAGSTPVEEVETISDGEEENGREGGKRYSQRGEGGRSRLWAMQIGFGGDGAAGRKSPGGGGEGSLSFPIGSKLLREFCFLRNTILDTDELHTSYVALCNNRHTL